MRDINDFMPKIPGMRWGAVSNVPFDDARIKYLKTVMPHDKKWHEIFEAPNEMIIDGHSIRRKTLESMT